MQLSQLQKDFVLIAQNFDFVGLDTLLNKEDLRPFCLPQYRKMMENSIIEKNLTEMCFLISAMPAFAHYEQTKEIPDCLLPFFDQTGHFYGLGIGGYQARSTSQPATYYEDNGNPPSLLNAALSAAVVPQAPRTTPDPKSAFYKLWGPIALEVIPKERVETKGKKVLLTSYVSKSNDPLVLNYEEVRGSIHGFFSPRADLSKLHHCQGDIYLWQVTQTPIPNLEYVGGTLCLRQVKELAAPKLSRVGRHLVLTNTQSVQIPELKKVGASLNSQVLEELDAPKLEEVGADLDLQCLSRANIPQLKRIGKSFLAIGLKSLQAKKLVEVGYELRIPPKIIEFFTSYQLKKLTQSVKEPKSKGILESQLSKRKAFSAAIAKSTQGSLCLER